MTQMRARVPEAKEARRQALLRAAQAEFEGRPYIAVTMADIAQRAGLAKGTAYLYFTTKEALFLSLLSGMLEGWFSELITSLQGISTAEGVAEQLTQSLMARPLLLKLLPMLHATLEQNVSVEEVGEFKRHLAEGMGRLSTQIESCLPWFNPGDGLKFLLRSQAFIVGLSQMSYPSDVVAELLKDPEFSAFKIDFSAELRQVFEILLRPATWTAPKT
jgi:AcrR family transcriptional regulator